jgi:S1-C subfamily serine protease
MNEVPKTERRGLKGFVKRFYKELMIALIFAIAAAIAIKWWETRTQRQAIEDNLRSMATIIVYGSDGRIKDQGSGFFINSTGLLVTNAHVVEGMTNAVARLSSGAFYKFRETKKVDRDADVAILQFDARETPSVIGLGNSDKFVSEKRSTRLEAPVGWGAQFQKAT